MLVNMKRRLLSPAHLVSLARIAELKQLKTGKGKIRIGAGVTVSDLIDSEMISENLSALSTGAGALGSPLIRNLATIGGNIGSARPAADLQQALMAYGTDIIINGAGGKRSVPITDLQPDEIITEFQVQIPPLSAGAGYMNIGARKAQDCNIVNVAAYLARYPDGSVQTARVVMGCVGPTYQISAEAVKLLVGRKPGPAVFQEVAEAARKECTPIDDFRGTAEYKRAMVGVLPRRTLDIALKEALARA